MLVVEKEVKTLLIMTGPQGSGNHLFSKVFAMLPGIFGWSALNDQYWVAHDKEPFAEAWHDASKLRDIDWQGHDYAVTSISCPYAYKGITTTPDYIAFIDEAKRLGYNVKVVVIGRDQNVLKHQQERVRLTHSLPIFEKEIYNLLPYNPIFVSTELLYLYKHHYVRSLFSQLDIPNEFTMAQMQTRLHSILKEDTNAKYFTAAPEQELDTLVRHVSGIKSAK
jgi:hypothetical protein